MNIQIKATKLELTPAIKKYIEEKMEMLNKYFGQVQVINCDFEVELSVGGQNKGKIYRAEANISVPGDLLRVEKSASDLYKAIDKVKDHLGRIIKKYKETKTK